MSHEKLNVFIKGLNSKHAVTIASQFIDEKLPQGPINVPAPLVIKKTALHNNYNIAATVDPSYYVTPNPIERYENSVVLMLIDRNTQADTHTQYLVQHWNKREAINLNAVTVIPVFLNHANQQDYPLKTKTIQWICQKHFNDVDPVYCDSHQLKDVVKVFDQVTERFDHNTAARIKQAELSQGLALLQQARLQAAIESLGKYPGYKLNHTKTGPINFNHSRNLSARFAIDTLSNALKPHSLDKFKEASQLLLCLYLAQPMKGSNKFHNYVENALASLAGDGEDIKQKRTQERIEDRCIDNATKLIAQHLNIGYILSEKQRSPKETLLIKLFKLMAKKEMAGKRRTENKINRHLKQIKGVIEHVVEKGVKDVDEKLKALESEIKGHSDQLRNVLNSGL